MTPELHWCLACQKLFLCWDDCEDRKRLAYLRAPRGTAAAWEGLTSCPDCGERPQPIKVV